MCHTKGFNIQVSLFYIKIPGAFCPRRFDLHSKEQAPLPQGLRVAPKIKLTYFTIINLHLALAPCSKICDSILFLISASLMTREFGKLKHISLNLHCHKIFTVDNFNLM